MTQTHFGSLDTSAVQDLTASQALSQTIALAAGTTFLPGQITGALDVVLINTTATPGTMTTRTAAQMYQDITNALGFPPVNGFQYFLRIVHQGAGTLTLAAGTGVSLGTGTTSVATATSRDYVVTVTNPGSITIQTTGGGILP